MPIKTPGPFSFCIFFVLFFAAFQPGKEKQNIAVEKNTIQFSFDYSLNTLLHPPYVSGVINDPMDPASLTGITVDVSEAFSLAFRSASSRAIRSCSSFFLRSFSSFSLVFRSCFSIFLRAFSYSRSRS